MEIGNLFSDQNHDNVIDDASDAESTTDYSATDEEHVLDVSEKNSQLAKALTEGADSTVFTEIVQKKTNKPIRTLNAFLSDNVNYRTGKADPKTNIIDIRDKKTFGIPKEEMPKFLDLLEDCRRDGCILNYQEKQNAESSGIMIDIDRYQKSQMREITEKHLLSFAQVVARLMNNVIDFSSVDNEGEDFKFTVFFIQKPQPLLDRDSKYAKMFSGGNAVSGNVTAGDSNSQVEPMAVYKDGFHMLIPEIMINRGAKRYIIDEIIKRKVMDNVFKGIDFTVQPAHEMIDRASSYVNVCFFGNTKGPSVAYKLTLIAEITLSVDMLADSGNNVVCNIKKLQNEDFVKCNLVYELSLSFYFSHIKTITPPQNNANKSDSGTKGRKSAAHTALGGHAALGGHIAFGGHTAYADIGFGNVENASNLMPTLLKKKHYNYKKELELQINHYVEINRGRGVFEDDANDTENSVSVLTLHDPEAALLKSFLALLDSRFARDYEMWRNIIFALAFTSSGYKPLAEWFSQRVPSAWNKDGVDKIWEEGITRSKTVQNPVTKRYIRHWARICNPEKYKELLNNTYHQILHVFALTYDGVVQHAMVAKILYSMLNEKFVTDVENRENRTARYCWYEFVLPEQKKRKGEVYKWRKQYEPSVLHIYIADHLPKIYANVQQYIDDKKDNAESDGLTKYWANVSKTFKTYTAKLSENAFQNGIISQAKYRFEDPGFIEELDSYEDIIGVGNGVLRVGSDPKLFTGFHEYKISKFTETNYIPYSLTNPWIEVIENLYASLYPEPDVIYWMKMWDSQSIEPRESDAAVLFWVGGGSNGKSTKISVIGKAMGKQYTCKIPITLLTSGYEDAGSANSAYAMMEGKTFARFTEPNKLMSLNTGRLKEMFGGEDQTSREVYGSQKNWEMKATPTIISNWDFNTDCTDEGFWRRTNYYKSKIKFVQNPNPNNKYEVKKDEKFIREYKKDPKFHEAMLSFLTENNKIFHRKYGGNIEKVPCPTIRKETQEWRNRQDTINRFITQRIVRVNQDAETPNGGIYGNQPQEYPLNMVASKYSEWYSENIGKNYNEDISGLMMRFENSCLQSYLVRHDDGSMILRGHRIREGSSDHVRENESIIGSFLEKQELPAIINNNGDSLINMNIMPPPELPEGLAPRTDSNIVAELIDDFANEMDALEKNMVYKLQNEGSIPLTDAKEIKQMDNILMRKSAAEDAEEKKSKAIRMASLNVNVHM